MDQKLCELLKDLPGLKAGTTFIKYDEYRYWKAEGTKCEFKTETILANPDCFKLIGSHFQPRMHESYHFISSIGEIEISIWYGTWRDKKYRDFGNCFKLESEAFKKRDLIERILINEKI